MMPLRSRDHIYKVQIALLVPVRFQLLRGARDHEAVVNYQWVLLSRLEIVLKLLQLLIQSVKGGGDLAHAVVDHVVHQRLPSVVDDLLLSHWAHLLQI